MTPPRAPRTDEQIAIDRRVTQFERVKAAALGLGGCCLSKTYVNARQKLTFKCSDTSHPAWKTYPQHVLNGHWCRDCHTDRQIEDLSGQRFGRLVALIRVLSRRPGWACRCDCGGTIVVRTDLLKRGWTKSCGCLEKPNKLPPGRAALKQTFNRYNLEATRRGISMLLTLDEFSVLTQLNCHYCGASPSNITQRYNGNGAYIYNGLDRVDSSSDYRADNVVACCKVCNRAKGDMRPDVFEAWLDRLSARTTLRRSMT